MAFSCCEYDGGEEEKREMDIARERSWRGKFRRRGRIIRPGAIRMDGKCPLTPLEVSNHGIVLLSMYSFVISAQLYYVLPSLYLLLKMLRASTM